MNGREKEEKEKEIFLPLLIWYDIYRFAGILLPPGGSDQ
jgi:hypothetical protein